MSSHCPTGKIKQSGLCYKPCPKNMKPVGPVCWGVCPSGFTDTGVDCLKHSYVEAPHPLICPSDKHEDAGLCYKPCRSHFKGVGPVCWGECPHGFKDTGVDCLKPKAYGRGTGHFSKHDCDKTHDGKKYGCQKWGLLWYPKCKPHFHNVACCVCSPDCPHGFKDIGISCQKPSYGRGVGTPIDSCPQGQQKSGALCYDDCKKSYHLVAGTCWQKCPKGFKSVGIDCQKPTHARGAGTIPKFRIKWEILGPIIAALIIAVLVLLFVWKWFTRENMPSSAQIGQLGQLVQQNPELAEAALA